MKISIIIPAYRESEMLNNLLSHLNQISNPEILEEIIVVDFDHSSKVDFKIPVIQSSRRGRAVQMNLGASKSKGEILYFLHADSLPPKNYDQLIHDEVIKGNTFGCFKMKFDLEHPILNFFCWFTRFPYSFCRGGDQSLFITREVFEKAGGYNENLMLAEDLEIIKHLKKFGQFSVIQENLTTSARRYKRNGIFRLQFIFALIQIKYFLGFPQRYLAWIYQRFVY